MNGPSFIGIGAQKAGTGWLYQVLGAHPDVWVPPVKELHYFDRGPRYPSPSVVAIPSPLRRFGRPGDRKRMIAGLRRAGASLRAGDRGGAAWLLRYHLRRPGDRWYAGPFPSGRGVVAGEITPSYSMLDEADVAAAKRVAPGAKIILLLRDPVERAWSQVTFTFLRRPGDALPDGAAVKDFIDSPEQALRGDSPRTLANWSRHFGEDGLFVGFTDEVASRPARVARALFAFLGVRPHDVPAEVLAAVVNPTREREMPPEVRAHLVAKYLPDLERLADRFGAPCDGWPARHREHMGASN